MTTLPSFNLIKDTDRTTIKGDKRLTIPTIHSTSEVTTSTPGSLYFNDSDDKIYYSDGLNLYKLDSCAINPAEPVCDCDTTQECFCGTGIACGDDWPTLGHDDFNTRSNPGEITINSSNVGSLTLKWTDNGSVLGGSSVEAGAIVQNGIAYYCHYENPIAIPAPNNYIGLVIAAPASTGPGPGPNYPLALWKFFPSPGFPTYYAFFNSSPCLADDKLFVAGLDTTNNLLLWALNPTNGNVLPGWPINIDPVTSATGQGNIQASPVVACGLVIVGVVNGKAGTVSNQTLIRGSIQAFDINTGSLIWRFRPGDYTNNGLYSPAGGDISVGCDVSIWSTPAIDRQRGLLFVGTSNASGPPSGILSCSLIALNILTGELNWSYPFVYNAVYNGKTFPSGKDEDLGASPNLFTGNVTWRDNCNNLITETRDLVGACSKSGVYVALDRDSGRVAWFQYIGTTPSYQNGNPSSIVKDGIIYSISRDDIQQILPSAMYAVPVPNGQVIPAIPTSSQRFQAILGQTVGCGSPGPCVPANPPCCGNIDTNIKAISCDNGKILWTQTIPGVVYGSPCEGNGIIYVGDINGLIRALNITNGSILATYSLNDGSLIAAPPVGTINGVFAPLIIAGGKLYIGYAQQNSNGGDTGLGGLVVLGL